MPAIDPPIIISGGGGDGLKPMKTKNYIEIECTPHSIFHPKKFRTKNNRDTDITSVTIDFLDMPGQEPIEIRGFDIYKIRITFNTDTIPRRGKSRSSTPAKGRKKAAAKGKKSAAKRPAARKRS